MYFRLPLQFSTVILPSRRMDFNKYILINPSALCLLSLRGLRTLRVRNQAFGPRFIQDM